MGRLPIVTVLLVFVASTYACGSDDEHHGVAPDAGAGGEGGEAAGGAPPEASAGVAGAVMAGAAGAAGSASGGDGGGPSAGCGSLGPTTIDADVIEATTWTADGSPYMVQHDIGIRAPLTIEPCVEVLIPLQSVITVSDEGSLEANGTEAEPIRFGRSEADEAWGNLRTFGRPISLSYATVEGGGELGNVVPQGRTMIDAQGVDADAATQGIVFFDHVTVKDSVGQGIVLRDGAGFAAGSQALTVTGNRTFPIALWARAVGTLPPGDYSGNGNDAVFLFGSAVGKEAIQEDATLFNRGVPYQVGGAGVSANLNVGALADAPAPLLTIEPGVTLRFAAGGHIYVGNPLGPVGAVSAVGTQAQPITFTSSAQPPAAGDWWGLYIFDTPDARTRFDHVIVEYAGGVSQTGSASCPYAGVTNSDAAIRFLGEAPTAQIVTNTQVRDSAGHAIDRGWTGAPVDFAPSNTFVNVAHCIQSFPHPEAPSTCPVPPECVAAQ